MSNCPIVEQTGDGIPVGKCDFYLKDGIDCPRHGDVSIEVSIYKENGKLTLENKLRERRGEPLLGNK